MLVVNVGGGPLSMVVGACRCSSRVVLEAHHHSWRMVLGPRRHSPWGVGPSLMVWVADGLRGGDVSAHLGIGHCGPCLTSLSIIVTCLGMMTWSLLLVSTEDGVVSNETHPKMVTTHTIVTVWTTWHVIFTIDVAMGNGIWVVILSDVVAFGLLCFVEGSDMAVGNSRRDGWALVTGHWSLLSPFASSALQT